MFLTFITFDNKHFHTVTFILIVVPTKSSKRLHPSIFKQEHYHITFAYIHLNIYVLDFYYNHVYPKAEEVSDLGLECVPGRTIISMEEPKLEPPSLQGSSEDDDPMILRSHMNTKIKEEYCKICVCSAEGKDEYCSGRPAMNVNECLRMSTLMDQFNENVPFDHTRTLAHRIRRGWLVVDRIGAAEVVFIL